MLMPSIFGENLFDDFFGDFPFYYDKDMKDAEKKLYGRRASHVMKTDIKETDKGYELVVDLPGFTKDEVKADLENGYLTISAEKGLDKDEQEKETGRYIRKERYAVGKLAHRYKQEGKKVMLVAADTFRAGAVAQLAEWGRRVDVPVVTGPEKSDPASVVFDGMERAIAENIDVLMIDTAGRLQNKDNLMAELEKIDRIIKRVVPDAPHETLLALDASTGQNALVQAKEFSKITPVTGIVLTKIDGTARGGVVLAIREELDIPVKLIGFGEKIDDIGPFHSENFMRGLLEGLI